jgi:protein-disulfide isomerase
MTIQQAASVALTLLLAAGCGLGLSSRGDAAGSPAGTSKPGAVARGGSDAQLKGVNLAALETDRQQKMFFEVTGELYAPCADQAVPLFQCVSEERPCAACTPMSQLVADQLGRGATKQNAKAAALVRFGADGVKTVPLADSPSKGPANAPVTIVVFSDFECPACRAAVPLLSDAQEARPKEVRLVHKFYPLPKHTHAKGAAYAAYAAMKQNKYWEMEEILFENQEELAERDLERYAEDIGLDMERFRRDRSSVEAKAMVERDIKDGDAAGLGYTPFILVNGRQFDSTYFRLDRDLDTWIATEIELARPKSTPPAPNQPPPRD